MLHFLGKITLANLLPRRAEWELIVGDSDPVRHLPSLMFN